jgi:hypothetical protein
MNQWELEGHWYDQLKEVRASGPRIAQILDILESKLYDADRLSRIYHRIFQYKKGVKVFMEPRGVRIQMMDAPWCEALAPTFEAAVLALANTIMQEACRNHWLRNQLIGMDLSPLRSTKIHVCDRCGATNVLPENS